VFPGHGLWERHYITPWLAKPQAFQERHLAGCHDVIVDFGVAANHRGADYWTSLGALAPYETNPILHHRVDGDCSHSLVPIHLARRSPDFRRRHKRRSLSAAGSVEALQRATSHPGTVASARRSVVCKTGTVHGTTGKTPRQI